MAKTKTCIEENDIELEKSVQEMKFRIRKEKVKKMQDIYFQR
jgi:hypothetical protein